MDGRVFFEELTNMGVKFLIFGLEREKGHAGTASGENLVKRPYGC